MSPQLRQGMAHRRLASVQPDRSAGHMFLREQRMQCQEQIEIDFPEFIHFVHTSHAYKRFQ
jgi:hypothetical protein